jgi:hypothetical protein
MERILILLIHNVHLFFFFRVKLRLQAITGSTVSTVSSSTVTSAGNLATDCGTLMKRTDAKRAQL